MPRRREPEPKVLVVCSCGWKGRRVEDSWDARACPRDGVPGQPEVHLLVSPAKEELRRTRRRMPQVGVEQPVEADLERLSYGHRQDLPEGRKGKPLTLQLDAYQAADWELVWPAWSKAYPDASPADLVAFLLREHARAEGLTP